jgi:Cu/Ag efflux protein CusF
MQRTSEAIRRLQYQLWLATLALCVANPAFGQQDKDKDKDQDTAKAAGAPARRQESMRASMTAKVTAINPETREVTLKGPDGKEKTLTVDKSVKRFDEIKVGDNVTVDYYVSLAGEVRQPTAEEKEKPLSEVTLAGKAPPGNDPAAGGVRMIKAVSKVEALDPAKKTVTIKGPRGRTFDVAVKDPATFEKLKEGDPIVITFTEALAVSLEKQPAKE